MRRCAAILLSNLALMALGCGDKCPPSYVLEDGYCRKCRAVEGAGNACVVGDASVLTGGREAGSGSEESDSTIGQNDAGAADRADAGLAGADASEGEMSPPSYAGADSSAPNPGNDAMSPAGCSSEPCQHGGVCAESGAVISCDCAGTGYQGARCENDIDECAGINVCAGTSGDGVAFSFPCVNEAPHYRCLGQFPDWPLNDPPNRFTKGFWVIDDAKTGLQWEEPGRNQGYRWEDAATYCESKGANWRLPTKAELESLIDDTRSSPSIDPTFTETPTENHWSSTLFMELPVGDDAGVAMAWAVSFADGTVLPTHSFNGAYVRCVRQRQ